MPIGNDDPWPQKPMVIPRTIADPTRPPGDTSGPPTYLNTETHWWDGSQLYGNNADDAEDGPVRRGRQAGP